MFGSAVRFARHFEGYRIMKNFLKAFVTDESGASAAEYALILVVVGLGIVVGALALSTSIGNAMTRASSCIDSGTSGACTNVAGGGGNG